MASNKSLSTQEVAELLHVSKSTIYELIRRGEINSYKVGRKVRFTQDDVDAYIARSRHEQSVQPVRRVEISSELLRPADRAEALFVISGQDVVLDILSNYLHQNGIGADRCYLSSFEGLLALYEKKVDAAACHLYAVDEKSFNVPYVKRLMPGVKAVLVNISYRQQGFYVAAGNPKEIRGWRDLARRDVSILNRRAGSSARILLDGQLCRMDLDPRQIKGYEREMKSHLTMAAAIADGLPSARSASPGRSRGWTSFLCWRSAMTWCCAGTPWIRRRSRRSWRSCVRRPSKKRSAISREMTTGIWARSSRRCKDA